MDGASSCSSHTLPLDWQRHSLAWLMRHCPDAAAYLNNQLAQLHRMQSEHHAVPMPMVDHYEHQTPDDTLEVHDGATDSFERRPRISESLDREHDQNTARLPLPMHQPLVIQKLDDRLVPAGIVGMPIPIQQARLTVKTASITSPQRQARGRGWIMRVSMLVLLGLVIEGLLARWLLS